MDRDLSMASSVSVPLAAPELGSLDDNITPTLINMKNLILHKMRLNANNLLIFARASPLVHVA